jgi:hypothetical protein
VKHLTRYCRYAVIGLLAPGVSLFVLCFSKLFLNPYPDHFWVLVSYFAYTLCGVGFLIWMCLIIGRVGSDGIRLWKKTKPGFLGAVCGIAALTLALEHSYASSTRVGKADAIGLFWLELVVGSYLLLRLSVALTNAGRN